MKLDSILLRWDERDVCWWWCCCCYDVNFKLLFSQLLRHHDFNTNWVVLRALKIQNFFEVFLYFSGERLQLTARGQKLDEFTFNTPSVHESFSGVESDAKKRQWSGCSLVSGLYYSNYPLHFKIFSQGKVFETKNHQRSTNQKLTSFKNILNAVKRFEYQFFFRIQTVSYK